jgi:hypothetical protein
MPIYAQASFSLRDRCVPKPQYCQSSSGEIISKFRLIFVVLLVSLLLGHCDLLETAYDGTYDFIYHFSEAQIEPIGYYYDTPTRQCVLILKAWEIGGEKRDALVVTDPGQITYTVPANRKGNRLYFGAGMKYLTGDGAWGFIIVIAPAKLDTVYRRFLDPADNVGDRKWVDEIVDLSQYDGIDIRIRFAGNPGPNGNNAADWFAWSTPVLKY